MLEHILCMCPVFAWARLRELEKFSITKLSVAAKCKMSDKKTNMTKSYATTSNLFEETKSSETYERFVATLI